MAGDVTNSIVEQLNFEVISISLIFLKFVVFEISFHLRGCDEKEVLSNDITCEEAVHLKQFEILHLHRCNKIGIPQFEEEKNHFWVLITEQWAGLKPGTQIFYLKSFVMDSVQAGKAVFDLVQLTSWQQR